MCGLSDLLRAAIMPRTIQRQGPHPKPTEIVRSTDAQDGPIKGLTKDPPEMLEVMMRFLDQLIEEETSNPTRRKNIQICKDYVGEHGYPEDDYYIRVVQGVVTVLNQEERFALPPTPNRADNFLLVSSYKASFVYSAEITNQCCVL